MKRFAIVLAVAVALIPQLAFATTTVEGINVSGCQLDPAKAENSGLNAEFKWTNLDAAAHLMTSEMAGLFSVNVPGAGSNSVVIRGSGTYGYICDSDPTKRGRLTVPLLHESPATVDSPFALQWAIGSGPPAGYVADVQMKKPGGRFRPLFEDVSFASAGVSRHKPGKYKFRARLENSTTHVTSDWSPAVTVKVKKH